MSNEDYAKRLGADRALIRGTDVVTLDSERDPPLLVVQSKAKAGKSTLPITLFDFPNEGDRPLIIAADKYGPDSCAALGYAPTRIKLAEYPVPGVEKPTYWQRSLEILENLEDVYVMRRRKPYSTIVVDCGSKQAELYYSECAHLKDGRARYGEVLDHCREFLNRLMNLGVPIIYLCWLAEGYTEESGSGKNKTKRMVLGGPQILGSFKAVLAGTAHCIFLLDKTKALANDPNANNLERMGVKGDGYKRTFRSKTYDMIECGGRYPFPDPMPADLGHALAMYYGMIENPLISGIELKM